MTRQNFYQCDFALKVLDDKNFQIRKFYKLCVGAGQVRFQISGLGVSRYTSIIVMFQNSHNGGGFEKTKICLWACIHTDIFFFCEGHQMSHTSE